VGNTHNYFAGGLGAWVHNAGEKCHLTPEQLAGRKTDMDGWTDVATGNKYRAHEISGALDYELLTGKTLKPTSKIENGKAIGDFEDIKTGEIIDHMGVGPGLQHAKTPERIAQVMTQFKDSIKDHILKLEKGVDIVLLDLKGFNKAQLAEIKGFMAQFSKDVLDKIDIINKNG